MINLCVFFINFAGLIYFTLEAYQSEKIIKTILAWFFIVVTSFLCGGSLHEYISTFVKYGE